MRDALADAPPERVGGAILITDGDVHDIPAAASALGFDAPLHALITGHEGERQRRIELIEAPRYGIVGKDQTIVARIDDSAGPGAPVSLAVRRDGETIATMAAEVGQRIEVKAPIEHAGVNVIELEIAPVAGELATDGDRAVVNIDGVRDKLRVLLVSGKPHPGERMWRNLLKSDANVDLVHFTILRPPEKSGDAVPINELSLIAFPVADLFGRKIKDFDLIIFDRYAQQSILPYTYLDNIVNYVRNGGALLMAEGPEYSAPDGLFYSPLGAIAPAAPTGRGRRDPVPGEDPRAWSAPSGDARPRRTRRRQSRARLGPLVPARRRDADGRADRDDGSRRQAAADSVAGRQGPGRAAAHRPDVAVGARLRRRRPLSRPFAPHGALADEGAGARGGGAARQRARPHDHGRAAERQRRAARHDLDRPGREDDAGPQAASRPGLSRAQATVEKFGLYRADDGAHVALVNVGPENPLEMRDVVSTAEKLGPLAEATGGSVRRLSTGKADDDANVPRIVGLNPAPSYAGGDYIGVKRTGSSELIGARSTSLASGFFGLALLLGAVVAGWLAEAGRFERRPRA